MIKTRPHYLRLKGSSRRRLLRDDKYLTRIMVDREAQRAIRERTKNQIEALEARIRELTSQEPHQELQKAIRQKEAVEAENARLKDHLATIVASIQPILSGNAGMSTRHCLSLPISAIRSSKNLPSPAWLKSSQLQPIILCKALSNTNRNSLSPKRRVAMRHPVVKRHLT